MGLASNFAVNLKRRRVKSGLSQQGLAQAAGVSVSYVSMLEREQRVPPLATIEQLAIALSVRPLDLLKA